MRGKNKKNFSVPALPERLHAKLYSQKKDPSSLGDGCRPVGPNPFEALEEVLGTHPWQQTWMNVASFHACTVVAEEQTTLRFPHTPHNAYVRPCNNVFPFHAAARQPKGPKEKRGVGETRSKLWWTMGSHHFILCSGAACVNPLSHPQYYTKSVQQVQQVKMHPTLF